MVYGFDDAHNKKEVAGRSEINSLWALAEGAQVNLAFTDGASMSDADLLPETGVYFVPSTANNIPSAHDYVIFVLSVDSNNSTIMQLAISTNGTYLYTRMYVNSAWTMWKRWASYSYVNNTFTVTYSGTEAPDNANGKNGDTYYLLANNAIQAMYVKINNIWMEVNTNGTDDSTESV